MGTILYLMLLCIIALSVYVIGKTVYYRKKIASMAGMMIAMTLGMTVGLVLGVIFGVIFSGNLFMSTIAGMIVGITAGFLAGIPISVMAVLDGLLSGLMGGMMGSMLGEMITMEYHDTIVKIMFFLFLAIVLILIYMIQKEVKGNKIIFNRNPLIPIAIFGLLFVALNYAGPFFTGKDSAKQNHSEHNESINNLLIKAKEYDFLPNDINLEVGETVTLSIKNAGTIEHDLEIINFNPKNVQKKTTHNHSQMETDSIHLHAKPGEKQTITFTPKERGVYRYVCTIPGHKESGMFGTLKVS